MDIDPSTDQKFARWILPAFFVGWTAFTILVVWWLVGSGADRADFLISVNQATPEPGMARFRQRVGAHVEFYWAYAWVLLAPYVLWVSLKFVSEKRSLHARVALQLAMGVAFIGLSQALSGRLDALQPKMIFIRHEEIIRHDGGDDSSESGAVKRTIEWQGLLGPGASPLLLPIEVDEKVLAYSGTNLALRNPTNRTRVTVGRSGDDRPSEAGTTLTNQLPGVPFTNGTSMRIARNLAPVLAGHISKLPGHPELGPRRRFTAVLDAVAYLALLGLAQTIHSRRRLKERDALASALEAKLTQSRLHALQTQLQPHFLFNALNGIATLVRRDPRTAEEMLSSLSELLRASLTRSGHQEIQLRDELEFLDRYLELQEMRFGDRLRVERHFTAEALDCLVPSLVFQPLVENAIRHGIEPSPDPGMLRIGAVRQDDRLVLTVEDNGIGLAKEGRSPNTPGNGIGLSSVRERLVALYGDRHEFSLLDRSEGGVIARIVLPAKGAAEPHAESKAPTTK